MLKKFLLCTYILWLIIFIVIPLILICYYAFTQEENGVISFSLDNFFCASGFIYVKVLLRSIGLALVCTLICFLVGYPIAYILADRNFRFSSQLTFLFLVPMWMNMLLRTYAWLVILENNGLINSLLSFLGFSKINLLYNSQAIILGMTYDLLPFMILPIYNSLKKINFSLIEAAQDLGANSIKIFTKIVLPLSMPGVISGVTMVFMPAITSFIISDLLGGGKSMLIGNLIEQQFLRVSDWHLGCAISLILILIMFLSAFILHLANRAKNNNKTNDKQGGNLF